MHHFSQLTTSSNLFYSCEKCEKIIRARNEKERFHLLQEKRKLEFLEALKRKRDRDLLTLHQQMRALKSNQDKLIHYISIKDRQPSRRCGGVLRPDKLKLIPAHIQLKAREVARQLHDESGSLTLLKQKLSADCNNIDLKVKFVKSQYTKDTTDEVAFQLHTSRKDMLIMDEESRQYEWNLRCAGNIAVLSTQSDGSSMPYISH